MKYLTDAELENGFDYIMKTPLDEGVLEMIVCRPAVDAREILAHSELNTDLGLVGDNWKTKGSKATKDGKAHPGMQLNIMNSRVINLIAQTKERWPLAGDQLYVDMSLTPENLPAHTRLSLGNAEIMVSDVPHLGCAKFVERFGRDAMIFVNSRRGKKLHLRGINAIVVKSGSIKTGDILKKIQA